MDENRKDIMEYYDEWNREQGTDIKWYRKILKKRWFKKIGKGNLIVIAFLVFLVSIICYFYKTESKAYATLNAKFRGWESDLTFASLKLESNNYAFGVDEDPAVLKNIVPMYIEINGDKILVQKGSLEIHAQLIMSDSPLRMNTPWPIVKGNLSLTPVRNPMGVFGDEKSFLGHLRLEKVYMGTKKEPNQVLLEHSGGSPVKLNLSPSIYEKKLNFKVFINGERKVVPDNKITLIPYKENEERESIKFIVSNFVDFGFDHHTGIENSEVSNFYIESSNTFLKTNTDDVAVLNIMKSANPQKIDVPKSRVLGNGNMNSTLSFDGKSFAADVTGVFNEMTIAEKSVFPNIWQWARDNAITILTTILTAAITAFLGRESLYSKKE
ncbi:hypothetical protein [Bacillus sp. SRB1LM]|uniref:hypothetical protein n=1 Tax=Bacillus sp. SRB1LM TaxID=2608688 RepID=UPI0018C37B93|nr:hypothetical protein [Bacillus sp. SRB1LM]MBG0962449.1 hypothetical protein [Bacillus sp. SRB1LM]